jgi:hypothetical protein
MIIDEEDDKDKLAKGVNLLYETSLYLARLVILDYKLIHYKTSDKALACFQTAICLINPKMKHFPQMIKHLEIEVSTYDLKFEG